MRSTGQLYRLKTSETGRYIEAYDVEREVPAPAAESAALVPSPAATQFFVPSTNLQTMLPLGESDVAGRYFTTPAFEPSAKQSIATVSLDGVVSISASIALILSFLSLGVQAAFGVVLIHPLLCVMAMLGGTAFLLMVKAKK